MFKRPPKRKDGNPAVKRSRSTLADVTVPPTDCLQFCGHRGYGARSTQRSKPIAEQYPENSLISFKKVMQAGADCIEFDLCLSWDKKLMVVHDEKLSKNCQYIVGSQQDDYSKKDAPAAGTRVSLSEEDRFLVERYKCADLKAQFDISMGVGPRIAEDDLTSRHLYQQMPEFSEVLSLVVAENRRRQPLGLPRVVINVELKGADTGMYAQQVIDEFNQSLPESEKILRAETFYISFYERELKHVVAIDPKANLVLGVPTAVQYALVNSADYSIITPNQNIERLEKVVLGFNDWLKKIPGRDGRGLDGVDMPIWDVCDATIKFFCVDNKLPIHLAIVPYSFSDLHDPYVMPVLNNFWKIIREQTRAFSADSEVKFLIKTDVPVELKGLMQKLYSTSFDVTVNEIFKIGGGDTIPLYCKPSQASSFLSQQRKKSMLNSYPETRSQAKDDPEPAASSSDSKPEF